MLSEEALKEREKDMLLIVNVIREARQILNTPNQDTDFQDRVLAAQFLWSFYAYK